MANCEHEKGGKKALRLEQIAAGAWVKGRGWDCVADYLKGHNLLQVAVHVGGGGHHDMVCWRLCGRKFAVTYVEGGKIGPSQSQGFEEYFVQHGECPQSLWHRGEPEGPPLGGPRGGDSEGMRHPICIQCFQG